MGFQKIKKPPGGGLLADVFRKIKTSTRAAQPVWLKPNQKLK
jgi:hypothetical protein